MRRRIATVLSIGLIAMPAAIALAAETTDDEGAGGTTATTGVPPRVVDARHELREARAERRRERRADRRVRKNAGTAASAGGAQGGGSTASPQLAAIAACESGGNPRAIGGGGQFRGKYQFTYSTWASVGGSGDPAAAPEAEQDRRAAMLLATGGAGHWPVCGG